MNSVETILLENIDNPDSLFIFPTEIAASRWADHLLRLKGGSLAMNKFIAWDDFKQNSIKSKVQNKKSIPSALRKIFAGRLVRENAEAVKQEKTPVFSSLIRTQWAEQASQFAPWLTGILPQLDVWFNKVTGLTIDKITSTDAEMFSSRFHGDEKDMYTLAFRYAHFLEAHSLFEPAWEKPPFNDEGKDCFIFFPESLSDFCEYRELLKSSDHVKTISTSDTDKLNCDTFFYTNSRSEITEAALYIRALHENYGLTWDSIAVCLPDSENYEPYVLREFTNRNIPFVKRTSKALADYPAGSFFRCVLNCASQDFSFSSLVSLITNKNLPWKDTILIDRLIQFGINNNCLYSWNEAKDGVLNHINVWEDAFDKPIEYYDKNIRLFFNDLKKYIFALRCSKSFAELRKSYFIFREHFFDMEKCSDETDLVLSRCISELMNLVELEKSFPDVSAVDPLLFLTEYLSEVFYLPQTKSSGVAILPYKTAAAAPFACHIILGAGQESLSVVYSRLDFLSKKKKEELGISDEDASLTFINMHKFNSVKISAFFCCEHTFSGFTIPHSRIGAPNEPKERYAAEQNLAEKFSQDYFKSAENHKPEKLHENQIIGYTEWKNRRLFLSNDLSYVYEKNKWTNNKEVQKFIHTNFAGSFAANAKTGKYSVSATSLQKYFQCSLKWLFERVFALKNIQIETTLMAENISGIVYHAILSNFFIELKNRNSPLLEPVQNEFGLFLPDSYSVLLDASINEVFNSFPSLKTNEASQMSALTARLLQAGKNDYQYHLKKCLAHFLSLFAGCTVTGSESYYQVERDSYIMKGYVDCILKNTSEKEKYIIIDFKLKNMPSRADCTAEEGNALADFQLPMYINLVEENEKFDVYTALFYSILNSKAELFDREWYNNIFEEFINKTEQFAQEISTGDFTVFAGSFAANEKRNDDCYDCDYQRICRTTYIIGRH